MAGSIELFRFFQKCQQTIGIHPRQPNPKQKRNQLSRNSIKAIFLISFALLMFTTAAFLLFEAKSMFDYVSMANGSAIYLIFVWQSEYFLEFIENCEGFIEKRPDSMAAYKESIEKIEQFNQFVCFGMFMSVVFLFTVAPYSFVRYYIFYMGEDSFCLFYPAWFPFDWKTPFGYLVAWLAQCSGALAVASIYIQFLNLVFGSCWLFIFIVEDIIQDVAAFNFVTTTTTSNENRTGLRKRFCDMVQIYSNAKQCVTEFNQLSKYSLFAFFSWILLAVSSILTTIQFELWADDSNLFEIALLILFLIWTIIFLFVLCEPGARVTNQLEEFSIKLNQCDWYLLPMELQRYYIIFVLDTQNPMKVLSYANIVCERETSKKIINKAWSYFMTLRKFKP